VVDFDLSSIIRCLTDGGDKCGVWRRERGDGGREGEKSGVF